MCSSRRSAASVAPRLLPLPRDLARHDGVHRRGRPVARRRRGRRGAAAHVPPGRGDAARDLAGRQDARVRRDVRGPDARSTRCRSAGGMPVRLTHDGGSALVVGWTPAGEVLYSTRRYSTLPNAQLVRVDPDGRANAPAARPGHRRRLRRGRAHALLHPPAVPGQPHQALQGRHRAEHLEVRRRARGDAAHRRLPGHQQDARCCGRAASTSSPTATAP